MDSAQSLVNAPEPTHDQMEKRFGLAVRDAHKVGLTALHDAGFNPRSLAFFKKQAEEDKLPVRHEVSLAPLFIEFLSGSIRYEFMV